MAAAVALGLVSMASTALEFLDAGERSEQAAVDNGTRLAGIEYTAGRRDDLLKASAGVISDNAKRASVNIGVAQLEAEADAINNAAAAGVEGASVDTIIQDSERNKANAKSAIESLKNQQMLQLEQDIVDNAVNATISAGSTEIETPDAANAFLGMFGAGLEAFDEFD